MPGALGGPALPPAARGPVVRHRTRVAPLNPRGPPPVATRAGAARAIAPAPQAAAGPHDVQELYEAGLCAWLLTFHPPARRDGAVRGNPGSTEVAGAAAKEKVVRPRDARRRESRAATGARETRGEEEEAGLDGRGPRATGTTTAGLSAVSGVVGVSVVGVSLAAQESALRKLVQNLRLRDFHDEELLAALADLEDGVLARRKEASSWIGTGRRSRPVRWTGPPRTQTRAFGARTRPS